MTTDRTPAAQAARQEAVLTDEEILTATLYGQSEARMIRNGRAIEQAVLSKLRAPVADERDAARYRVLRRHTAPLRLAESMGIPRKQVKRSDDPAARVDEMCDAALASAPVAGEAQTAASAEHYEEVKATLQGAHRIMEGIADIERRAGPIGSHARGYTHKITAALRHLDALYAAPQASEAVPTEPLRVFSAGIWTYDGTGQAFSHTELDEAAFVTYRAALSAQPGAQKDRDQ